MTINFVIMLYTAKWQYFVYVSLITIQILFIISDLMLGLKSFRICFLICSPYPAVTSCLTWASTGSRWKRWSLNPLLERAFKLLLKCLERKLNYHHRYMTVCVGVGGSVWEYVCVGCVCVCVWRDHDCDS